MLQVVFEKFKERFEHRFQSFPIVHLGEDSVRYDFFTSLMKEKKIESYEIQLEFPIHPNSYVPKMNIKSKRDENPQVDLYLNHGSGSITVEFAFFKRNKTDSSIKTTENLFKALNDMLRLSLNKSFVPNDAYFICIADSKMLGARTGNLFNRFPAANYNFNHTDLDSWIKEFTSAEQRLDARFVNKARELGHSVRADLIFNEVLLNPDPISQPLNQLETRLLIYRVK